MKTIFSHHLIRQFIPNLGTVIVVAMMLISSGAWAAEMQQPVSPDITPGVINYQGTVTGATGTPLNASVDMTFSLYNTPSGGVPLWQEVRSGVNAVPVSNGLFNVLLGSLTPISPTVWNNSVVYLGIKVGADPEMTPREQVTAVPWALVANTALTVVDGSITREKLGFTPLLAHKTCGGGCPNLSESVAAGWSTVKGNALNDLVEVTATTHGGPIVVQMTTRYTTEVASGHFCVVQVLQNNNDVKWILLDGADSGLDFGCSGSFLITDLPAGTYTFRALGWVGVATTVTWREQRQIAVFEY